MAPPPRNPLVVALGIPNIGPEEFVLTMIQKIKSSQLEEALLMLPFSDVMNLLKNLAFWIERVCPWLTIRKSYVSGLEPSAVLSNPYIFA